MIDLKAIEGLQFKFTSSDYTDRNPSLKILWDLRQRQNEERLSKLRTQTLKTRDVRETRRQSAGEIAAQTRTREEIIRAPSL